MGGNQPTMSPDELEKLGACIREVRERCRGAGSGPTVAAEAGVTKAALSHWEGGKNAPSLAALLRLADAIGCDVAELLEPFRPRGRGRKR